MSVEKRMHIHLSVSDLADSIAYYTALFGVVPTREKPSYAQWRLDNPSVNFAISLSEGGTQGLSHLGIQVGDDDELSALNHRLETAKRETIEDANATCCYARSDKHWSTDPSDIVWEFFHTHEDLDVFGEAKMPVQSDAQPVPRGGCC